MKKRIEAWVVVRGAEGERLGVFDDAARAKADAAGRYMRLSNNIRAVHLVEHSPTAERVLKAAKKWFDAPLLAPNGEAKKFWDAFAAHLKSESLKGPT